MIKEVGFPSEGATLRGLLFLPESTEAKPPVIIMAHGTSGTIRMVADKYAESFCRAGLAALLYDHRNLGQSGGEPRQEINPWIQCRGYRDAISFVTQLSDVDSTRIALWGDSYTGGRLSLSAPSITESGPSPLNAQPSARNHQQPRPTARRLRP